MGKETRLSVPPMSSEQLHQRFWGALNDVRAIFGHPPGAWSDPARTTRLAGTISVEIETRTCSPFTLERGTARHPGGALHSVEVTLKLIEAPFIRFYVYGNEAPNAPVTALTHHEGYLSEEQSAALLRLFERLFRS